MDVPLRRGLMERRLDIFSVPQVLLVATLIIGVLVSNGHALSRLDLAYADVSNIGQSCPTMDSCGHRRSSGSRELDSVGERNCACDYLCDGYGDCCVDAPSYKQSSKLDLRSAWKCLELRQFGGVYMKSSCGPQPWSPELVDLCENSKSGDLSDPLGAMPVTDATTGFTYKNYYCGLCDKDTDDGLVLWTPRLECPTLTFYNNSRKNLTHDYVFQNLLFDGSSWGLYLDGDNGSLFFHDCAIDPVMPRLLESKIRLCKTQSVSKCPASWKDEDVRAKCAAYTGLRYFHSESYRNVHCAICNEVNVSLLTCQSVEYREMFMFRTFEHRAFSLLLDINEFKGKDVGLVQKCKQGEVFDPFFKKCRSLVCLPGHTRHGNKCVPEVQWTTTNPPVLNDSRVSSGNQSQLSDTNSKEQNMSDATDVEKNETKNETKNDSNLEDSQSSDFENLTGISYNTSMLDGDSNLKNAIGKYKDCLLITLQTGSYVMYDNKTIYVPEYGQLYEPTKYFSVDGSVLICSFFEEEAEVHFSASQAYVTEIGLGISMFFLLLHFLIFCVVPDLQNLSGKNLVSQCAALFNAYLFFIISQISELSATPTCTAVAFLTTFFFQASFFWMNTMAYDVWRTLRMATMELRVSIGRQRKRFLIYSIYSWVMPLLVVSLAAIAEYTDFFPDAYKPRFAQPSCWFKSRRALMVFFAVPLFAIVLLNIFLFVSSARMIIMTTKKTTVKQQCSSQRRTFKLYLRLAILMGLTWTVGLVAGYADLEFLWYCFVLMNTLQGLFIFIAFSCTTKVFNYLRDYVAKYTKASDLSRSAIHSTTSNSGCNSTALTSVFSKSSTKLLAKKKSASPTHSSTSSCSKIGSTYH